MKKKQPFVSIIMPVYNAGDFLMEALLSLQAQTYINWELIAVDNNSSDDSLSILKKFASQDKRIKVFENKKNQGVSHTANIALTKTKGHFIARMDADDISLSKRLEKQVQFLQKHPRVVAVGGQCQLINKKGKIIGEKLFPTDGKSVKKMIFHSAPLQQPTLMVNTLLLPKKFKWYEDEQNVAEEIELLFKFFKFGQVRNLPETVLQYRLHGQNISLKNPKKTFLLTFKVRLKAIIRYQYRPTLSGILATFGQLGLVLVLPNSLIYPTYAALRGISKINFPQIQLAPKGLQLRAALR